MPRNHEHERETENYDDELSLFDLFKIVWRRRFLIVFMTGLFGIAAMAYSLWLPVIYKAGCRIMPPGSGNSRAASLAASLGGLADFIGIPVASTNGRILIGLLESDSVADEIIDKFNLMEVYSTDKRIAARRMVTAIVEAEEDKMNGIITISCLNKEPEIAAEMANAFVTALQNKLLSIAAADIQQKKNFFETQLIQAQKELNEAEDAMIKYQQSNGLVVFETQTQSLLSSIASLRNQIAAKNVEISSLRSYARNDNPRLKLAQSQLEAMTRELRRLEQEQQKTESGRLSSTASGDLLSSIGQIPELGIEYQRYVRTLRFASAKYESMLRQYESTRMNEANDMTSISVIDYAVPPDKKFSPKRTRMTLIGAAAGFGLAIFWAFASDYIRKVLKEEREQEKNNDDDEDDY